MGGSIDEQWEGYARLFREPLVILLARLTGDPSLAEDVTHDALLMARSAIEDPAAEPPSWRWLRQEGTRLAVQAFRRQSRDLPLELEAEALIVPWYGDDPSVEATELLVQALHRLPAREAMALRMHYLDDYTLEAGARHFNLERRAFLRLLATSRRRLRREYERLRDERLSGLGPAAGLLGALRRLRARWHRSSEELGDRVAAWSTRFDPARTFEALVAGTANLSVAVVVAGAGVLSMGAPAGTDRTRPVAAAVPVVSSPSSVQVTASRVASWITQHATTKVSPVLAPTRDTTPTVEPGGPTRQTVVGPVSKTEYRREGVTAYTVDAGSPALVTPTPTPAPSPTVDVPVPAKVPPPPTPSPPDVGQNDEPLGVGVFYTCPPPGERPLVLTAPCAVLEPEP